MPLGSTLEITAGSVVVVATIPATTPAEAASAQRSLRAYTEEAGRGDFEAAMSAANVTYIDSTLRVEVEEVGEGGSSPAVAVAAAAAGGGAVTAALLGGGMYLRARRQRRCSPPDAPGPGKGYKVGPRTSHHEVSLSI